MSRVDKNVVAHLDSLIQRYPLLEQARVEIYNAFLLMENCYSNGGKLLIAGNGGSASDSEHIVGELMKSFRKSRPIKAEVMEKLCEVYPDMGSVIGEKLEQTLPAISLVTHESLTTAFSNDVDADYCVAQQLYGYGNEGDVFIGISTSGNSKNIVYAAALARALGIHVVGLTGARDSRLAKLSDVAVRVPSTETYIIQEFHLPIYHCWCSMLEESFFE